MALDVRTSQTDVENVLRDTILYALGHRLPAVDSLADLRALPTRGASGSMRHDDDLICILDDQGAVATAYRWSSISRATPTGTTIVRPLDVPYGSNGRWLSWTSPLRFEPTIGGNSCYLHEVTSGPLRRVIVIDKNMTEEEVTNLILGQVPSVLIEATDDDPDDADQIVGHRWLTDFEFTISVVAQNLRDRREAAQGTTLDVDPGANTIDGAIKSLLAGVQLFNVLDGIRAIRVGRGHNWVSELGQRRIIRSRLYTVQATEEHPNAPNDIGAGQEIDAQAEMLNLNDQTEFDPLNYISSGMAVPTNTGLTVSVGAGVAVIAGQTVNYAGESHVFGTFTDTYRDLLPNGTMTFVAVDMEGEPPPVTATALRVGMSRATASSVIDDRFIAAILAPYRNPVQTLLT